MVHISRAFLLCPGGCSSWLEATSKSTFDAVEIPDRVSLQDGENPAVGVMLQTLENRPAAAQERPKDQDLNG